MLWEGAALALPPCDSSLGLVAPERRFSGKTSIREFTEKIVHEKRDHDSQDRELGMQRKITRRDFLNGVAMTAGAAMMPWDLLAANGGEGQAAVGPVNSPNYYPPALTGMRGSHAGSFETAHGLRDGTFWDSVGQPEDTHETYDLIIVGGGISGLSAAHFYRKANGGKARILILDNHDDFGGHAKRNEFRVNNAFRLGFGGTFSIESPAPYSAVAKGVIQELGIDVASYRKYFEKNLYPSAGLYPKIFFNKETFGADKLVFNPSPHSGGESEEESPHSPERLKKFLAEAPLAEQAKIDLQRLYNEPKDYLPGLSSDEKKAKLARISYARFLTEIAGVHPDIVKMFQALPHPLFGVGIDAVSAQDAWGLDWLGFDGMKLDPTPGKGMNRDAIPNEEAEKYFFHFPDGNATIARLLVRQLIPAAIPGSSSSDVVLAKANYSKLDDASSPVRIRLNSTAVRVKHMGDAASAKEVEVTYARGGKVYTVESEERDPCLLARCDPVYLRRTSRQTKTGSGLRAEGSAALYQRGPAQLDFVSKSRREFDLLAGHVSHLGEPRPARKHWGIRVRAQARRADRHPHDESGVPSGPPCPRATQHGSHGTLYHDIRNDGAQHSRPTGSDAGCRGLRSGARHCGDHRQSLAARLRLRVQLAVRFFLAGGRRDSLRSGETTARPHCYCERRRRRLRLYRRGY